MNNSLANLLGLTEQELLEIALENTSAMGFFEGYASESHFKKFVQTNPKITNNYKPGDHNLVKKGDRVCVYQDTEITFELKTIITDHSVSTRTIKKNIDVFGEVSYSGAFRTRGSRKRQITFSDGSTIETYNNKRGQFDAFAVCVRPFTGKWEWMYCLESDIPSCNNSELTPIQNAELLRPFVLVQWPPKDYWTDSLDEILERACVNQPTV